MMGINEAAHTVRQGGNRVARRFGLGPIGGMQTRLNTAGSRIGLNTSDSKRR